MNKEKFGQMLLRQPDNYMINLLVLYLYNRKELIYLILDKPAKEINKQFREAFEGKMRKKDVERFVIEEKPERGDCNRDLINLRRISHDNKKS